MEDGRYLRKLRLADDNKLDNEQIARESQGISACWIPR